MGFNSGFKWLKRKKLWPFVIVSKSGDRNLSLETQKTAAAKLHN